MNETAASSQIPGSMDLLNFKQGDRNNLVLADQVQFSSLLKMMIAPPEQKLQEAQARAKPADRSDPERATPWDDGRPQIKVAERRSDRRDRDDDAGAAEQNLPELSLRLDTAEAKEAVEVSDEPEPVQQASAPVDRGPDERADDYADQFLDRPEFAEEVVSAAQSIIDPQFQDAQPQVFANHAETVVAAATSGPVEKRTETSQSNSNVNSRMAATNLGAALTDKRFSDIAEDFNSAVNQTSDQNTVKADNHTAASALAQRQANDLARKLGGAVQVPIKINVSNDAPKPQSAQSQALTSAALLAELGITDGDAGTEFSGQQKAAGNQVSPDRQGHGGTSGQANEKALGQTVQQGKFANFGQALRSQAMATGTKNAAEIANLAAKAQPISVDTNAPNATSGQSGPSQVSQTAKANPTTAARPPPPIPKPVEQVAVQIKKAIGSGADKISIRLQPAQLGKVEIQLEIGKDGMITAAISAERPETLEMLQRDSKALERALQDAGLRTNSDSLSFSLRNDNAKHGEEAKDRGDDHGGPSSDRAAGPDEAGDHGMPNNEYIPGQNMATNGHIDIRV